MTQSAPPGVPPPSAGGDQGGEGLHAASRPLGLATAAAAGASSCIFLFGGPYVAFIAFMVAWFHAGLFGLPLYLKLSRTRPLTEGASVGAGCAVGALPVLVLESALLLLGASVGLTGGWFGALLIACIFGFFGMLGGAAFWAVMRRHAAPWG